MGRRAAGLAAGFLSALLLSEAPARAAFETSFLTGQAAAMGGASLASSGDSGALFSNPAGLAGMAFPEAYFTYSDVYAGLSGVGSLGDGFMTAGVPTKLGAIGVGVGAFSATGLLQERTVSLGFARRFFGGVQLGVAGKQLYHAYQPGGDPLAAQDPVFKNGTSRGAFSFDAGVVVPVAEALQVGVAARNLNSPDVGLATPDRVRREVQAGMALGILDFRTTGDLSFLSDGRALGRAVPALGLERRLCGGRLAFRAGASTLAYTGGVGLRLGRMGFDYALSINRSLLQNNMGTHTVGLRLEFGGAP